MENFIFCTITIGKIAKEFEKRLEFTSYIDIFHGKYFMQSPLLTGPLFYIYKDLKVKFAPRFQKLMNLIDISLAN